MTQLNKEFIKAWVDTINSGHGQVVMHNHVHPTIKDLCEEAYQTAKSKGWHDRRRTLVEALALVVCEVSEAIEADRRREGKERVEEELADVCIRVFDTCAEFGFDLEKAILKKMEFNKTREHMHGGKAY